MAKYHIILSFFILSSCLFSVSHGREKNHLQSRRSFRVRAVSLGGWLVTEGWIKPSLFAGIPNKDFLDGTGLQFKSIKFGTYLSAEKGGGDRIVASRRNASDWETFKLWRISETKFNLRGFNKQFVGLNKANHGISKSLVAVETTPSLLETFKIVRKSDDLNRVRIQASNGFFLQVKSKQLVTADYQGNTTLKESVKESAESAQLDSSSKLDDQPGNPGRTVVQRMARVQDF